MSELETYKKYLLEQEEKRKIENDLKIAKARFVYLLFEFILGVVGMVIIGYNTNGWVCFGLFLMFWGNNMGVVRQILNPKHNSTKQIWSKE